jgi:hypothetical protein
MRPIGLFDCGRHLHSSSELARKHLRPGRVWACGVCKEVYSHIESARECCSE